MDSVDECQRELDLLIRASPKFDRQTEISYDNMLTTITDSAMKLLHIYLFWAALYPEEAHFQLVDKWK